MKKIFVGLGALVVVLAGVLYFMLGSINEFVKTQIETLASHSLQTTVSVANVNIELTEGLGEISGFEVANPAGYQQASAFRFDTVRLDIGPASLLSSPIVIEEILLDSVSVLYELNAQGKGNLNVLLDAVSQDTASSSQPSKQTSAAETDQGEPLLIRVKKISVKDTGLALDFSALGQDRYEEVLPTFYANNIGGEKGLPPDQLGQEIAQVMLQNLTREAEKKQKEKLKKKLKEKAKAELEKHLGDKVDAELGGQLKGLLNKF